MRLKKQWVFAAILVVCGACITICCISSDDNPVVKKPSAAADDGVVQNLGYKKRL